MNAPSLEACLSLVQAEVNQPFLIDCLSIRIKKGWHLVGAAEHLNVSRSMKDAGVAVSPIILASEHRLRRC